MTTTTARSISRPVRERLHKGRLVARVLAVFERACDLVTPDGDVVALVIPQIGDGPLNVVVEGRAGLFAGVDVGAPVTLTEEQLRVGGLRVDLEEAVVWEPRPDWDRLRARRATVVSCLPLLRTLCLRRAPAGTLLALLGAPLSSGGLTGAMLATAQRAVEALREGWGGDLERLQEGVTALAGLGGGLTPASDDFLTGVMLWAWLAHPAPAFLCRAVVEVAVPRTTTLSAAFLRAAARGECTAAWHMLLTALSQGAEAQIALALQGVLAHGATSGADGLVGFLYASSWGTHKATGAGKPAPSARRQR